MWKELTTKNWKKIKEFGDSEEKRPPWRMVSVSTLPKADKNALIRAKLLDASRRLRAGKNQIGIQADLLPKIPVRDSYAQICDDLLQPKDKAILTEGKISERMDNGRIVLTFSVSQMTEQLVICDKDTQTATPRSSNKFFQAHYDGVSLENKILDTILVENESKLGDQKKELNDIDILLRERGDMLLNTGTNRVTADSSYSRSKSHQNEGKQDRYSKCEGSTLASWHFDNDAINLFGQPLPTKIDQRWKSVYEVNTDRGLSDYQHFSLLNKNSNLMNKCAYVANPWLEIIQRITNEAQALLNIFEQLSILHGPDIRLNKINDNVNISTRYLSEYWFPIQQQYENMMTEKMKNFNPLNRKKFTPVRPYVDI